MGLEPIGSTLADHLAPGGKLAGVGELLRYVEAELARLTAAGASPAATARMRVARKDLLTRISVIDAAEPRVWRVTPDTRTER